jgi:hypothetical protein
MYNIVYLNNLQLATQVSFLGNFADDYVLQHLADAKGKFSLRYLTRLDHLLAEIIKELDRVFKFEYKTLSHLDLEGAKLFIDVLDKVSPGFHARDIF